MDIERDAIEPDTNEPEAVGPQAVQDGWIIQRPKRAYLTAEESLRRTEDFINNPKRKERFIAAIRTGKS